MRTQGLVGKLSLQNTNQVAQTLSDPVLKVNDCGTPVVILAERKNAVGDHIAARRELDDALARGVEIVRKLTSLMKVKYANNPGKLAEWAAATHIERAPRRSKPKPPHSAGTPPPSPPSA